MSMTENLLAFREIFQFIPLNPVYSISGNTVNLPISKLTNYKTANIVYQQEITLFTIEPFLSGTVYVGYKKLDAYSRVGTIKVYRDDESSPIMSREVGFADYFLYLPFECDFGHRYTIKCYGSQNTGAGNATFYIAGTIGLKDNPAFVINEIN